MLSSTSSYTKSFSTPTPISWKANKRTGISSSHVCTTCCRQARQVIWKSRSSRSQTNRTNKKQNMLQTWWCENLLKMKRMILKVLFVLLLLAVHIQSYSLKQQRLWFGFYEHSFCCCCSFIFSVRLLKTINNPNRKSALNEINTIVKQFLFDAFCGRKMPPKTKNGIRNTYLQPTAMQHAETTDNKLPTSKQTTEQ